MGMPGPIQTAGLNEFTAELLPFVNADMVIPRENLERPGYKLTSEFKSQHMANGEKAFFKRGLNDSSKLCQQRQGGMTIQGTLLASDTVYNNIHRLDQLDSSIKAMKRDIILTIERELSDLKASLVNMVENTGTVRNFSDVV